MERVGSHELSTILGARLFVRDARLKWRQAKKEKANTDRIKISCAIAPKAPSDDSPVSVATKVSMELKELVDMFGSVYENLSVGGKT